MAFLPTGEQRAILDAYVDRKQLVINAGAGTGKTSTLKMLAQATPGRSATYVAYNKAISQDAAKTFPAGVQCSTAHSLAYRAVGYMYRSRLNGPRLPARETARLLGITADVPVDDRALAPESLARLASETVARFCRTADREINVRHLPFRPGLETPSVQMVLRTVILPLAVRIWQDVVNPAGQHAFAHDYYLKMWQLTGPSISSDVIFLDEAQDADPLISAIVNAQDAQKILVGDSSQAIYGWRGALNSMETFPADVWLNLSQSFRFGPAVATEANKWLELLSARLRLTGFDQIPSEVRAVERPDVVLCRSNGEAVIQVMDAHTANRKVALVGGGEDIKRFAQAAGSLKEGRSTSYPELMMFRSWSEVQEYAEHDVAGLDLKVRVTLVDRYGPGAVIYAMDRLEKREEKADLIVSTAHKAKGREWDTVKIAGDFREPKPDEKTPDVAPTVAREEAMLAYVAVTRAKKILDREGLAWVDKFLPVNTG